MKDSKHKPKKRRGAIGLLAQFSRCPYPIDPPERHFLPTKSKSPARTLSSVMRKAAWCPAGEFDFAGRKWRSGGSIGYGQRENCASNPIAPRRFFGLCLESFMAQKRLDNFGMLRRQ